MCERERERGRERLVWGPDSTSCSGVGVVIERSGCLVARGGCRVGT